MTCLKCGSEDVMKNGLKLGKQMIIRKSCGKQSTIGKGINNFPETDSPYEFKIKDNEATLSIVLSKRVTNAEELYEFCNINPDEWIVKELKCGAYESHSRLRQYLHSDTGKPIIRTDDKHIIVPLYKVHAILAPNKPAIEAKQIRETLIADCKKFAPKYPVIHYKKSKEKYLLEPDMPDLHFGKQAWAEESGDDYDIKIAEEMAISHIDSIINQTSYYHFDRILFPIGNDFFNVNSKFNTTVNGTPQQEDTRSQKTFKKGRELAVKLIDRLSVIAPVDVIIVPGNHDEERVFYLGDSLECWYHKNANVNVDNRAIKRKYYTYGKSLIGFTHGCNEKLNELPLIMSLEEKKAWAECEFYEWQTGDKHHKKEIKTSLKEDEQKGVMVRILRSLSGNDAWHFDKGYIGGTRKIEAFVRHIGRGLIAQIHSSV